MLLFLYNFTERDLLFMAIYSKYSDQDLMALLKQGDHTAYTEVFNRYWNKLLAIV